MTESAFRKIVSAMRRVQLSCPLVAKTDAESKQLAKFETPVDEALKSLKPQWMTIDDGFRELAEEVLVLRFVQKQLAQNRTPELLVRCEMQGRQLDDSLAGVEREPVTKTKSGKTKKQTEQTTLF